MALYLDQALYNTPAKYFAALAALTDFWDTITDDTLTKGGVTLTLTSTTTITVSGFDLTMTNSITGSTALTKTMIAYTDNGIIGLTNSSNATNSCGWAIGCDDAGNWGAVIGKGATPAITELLANGVSSTTFGGGTVTESNENTQIVDMCADKGDFIFKDVKRVLQSTQPTYSGRLQIDSGDKFVQSWGLALKYTD
jgi:hypothetical protein